MLFIGPSLVRPWATGNECVRLRELELALIGELFLWHDWHGSEKIRCYETLQVSPSFYCSIIYEINHGKIVRIYVIMPFLFQDVLIANHTEKLCVRAGALNRIFVMVQCMTQFEFAFWDNVYVIWPLKQSIDKLSWPSFHNFTALHEIFF